MRQPSPEEADSIWQIASAKVEALRAGASESEHVATINLVAREIAADMLIDWLPPTDLTSGLGSATD